MKKETKMADFKLITSSSEPCDPFNLDNLRLSQDFTQTAGVKQLLRTVPVRKPNPQDFVRVHPDASYRINLPVIELKDEREEYIVARELVGELTGELVLKTLFTAINRQGVLFLWPVRMPEPDGRQMEWHRSMREAAELAIRRWVRVKAGRKKASRRSSKSPSGIASSTPSITLWSNACTDSRYDPRDRLGRFRI
jgi:hypothetical protein